MGYLSVNQCPVAIVGGVRHSAIWLQSYRQIMLLWAEFVLYDRCVSAGRPIGGHDFRDRGLRRGPRRYSARALPAGPC